MRIYDRIEETPHIAGDPDKALARWKIDLAAARGLYGLATICAFGDSIVEGFYSPSTYYRWTEILARRLGYTAWRHDASMTGGEYVPMVSGNGAGTGWPGMEGDGDDPWTRTGVVTNYENIGGPSNTLVTLAPGAKMSGQFVGDDFALLVTTGPAAPNAANLRFRIDGVTMGTFNTYSAATASATYLGPATAGTGFGLHTIEIENIGGAGDQVVEGIFVYRNLSGGQQGVLVYNFGNAASEAAQWVAAGANSWDNIIARLNPAVLIWGLGTNDKTFGRTPAQFEASMKTLVDRCEAKIGADAPKCGYVFPLFPSNNFGVDRPKWWTALQNVARYVPDGRGIAIDFLSELAGVQPVAGNHIDTKLLHDLVHPDTAGGQNFFADVFYRLLDPSPPISRRVHTQLIGTTAGTTVNIYHGFASRHVKAVVTLAATSEEVGIRVTYPNDAYCTIDFDTYVRAANEFRVTVYAP